MRRVRLLAIEHEGASLASALAALARGFALDAHPSTPAAAVRAAGDGPWDLVLVGVDAAPETALRTVELLSVLAPRTPLLVVAGAPGRVSELMRAGARDVVLRGDLERLLPAAERELARTRAADPAAEGPWTERRFRALAASLDGLILMLDEQGRCTDVFGRWLERPEHPRDRFVGHAPATVLGASEAAEAEAVRRGLAGETYAIEWPVTGPDGGQRQLEMTVAPLRERNTTSGLVAFISDKTEQKRALAQLLVSDRMASVGTLAAGVAHEINNPLAAVIANLDYVTAVFGGQAGPRPATDEGSDVGDAISEALEAAGQVREIVRDLKLFSGSGDADRRGPVDLNRALDSAARMAWNELRHRAQLVKRYGDIPAVYGNEPRLGQVFLNLIMNAVQAIPEGRAGEHAITLTTRVDDGGRILAEISDTGAGIAPAVIERLFTPFFTTKPVGVGTGLGLAISHRIVTGLGGSIELTSQLGSGTTFTIALEPAFEQTEGGTVRPAPMPTGGGKARVLIVDDERTVRASLRRTLKSHDVLDVETGAEALALLRAGREFDVILCDLMMPEMTGMELHAHLQADHPVHAARVVFLTGGAFTPSARTFLTTTENQWLEKPYDPATLRRLVTDRAASAPAAVAATGGRPGTTGPRRPRS